MTSIDEMSETEAGEYIRAEITALRPILGELVPAFWQTLTEQWKREGRPGIRYLRSGHGGGERAHALPYEANRGLPIDGRQSVSTGDDAEE
jgi:hypothetical protein